MNAPMERVAATLWNGVAGALPRVAVLLAGLWVAQRFGADAFARYSLALSTLAVAGSLPGATLTTVASKFVPEFAGGDPSSTGTGMAAIATFALLLAGVLGAATFLLAPALASLFGIEPPVADLLRTSAVAVVATVLAGALTGLLVGAGRFAAAARAYLAGFVLFAISLAPLSIAFGPAGVLLALALLYFGAGALAIVTARPMIARDPGIEGMRARWVALWRFFVPTLIAAGMVTPVVWLCNTLLTRHAEPLAALARFNAAYSWFAVVSFVPAVLAQVEFVRMSQAKARGDTRTLGRELRRFVVQNALLMLPLAAAGIALAPLLVGVYRLEGADAERTLMLMLGAALVASLGNPAGLFLAVIDRIWIASALNLAWGIITLALAWLLRGHGALGVAAAFLLGYALHFAVAIAIAHRLLSRFRAS